MHGDDRNRSLWRFFDGAASVSASMLLAVLLDGCALCGRLPALDVIQRLTDQEDGIIIVATLLLFPTTAGLYGVFKMFFAAKEAVERKARERGRQEGRREERELIAKELAQSGVTIPPELARRLAGNDE